jgi:antirestriction protein
MSDHEQQPQEPGVPEQEPRWRPRIYVASLADYNAGRLHGAWLDAARHRDELEADIAAMLAASREPIAEDWAIHDYDGFGPLHLAEHEDLDTIARVANGIALHGEPFAAFAAWVGPGEANVERFDDQYWGSWDSREHYAEEMASELGFTAFLEQVPAPLQPYVHVDYAGFARDLEASGHIHVADLSTGQVAVFEGG